MSVLFSNNFSGKPRKASMAAYRQLLAENHVEEILRDVKQNGNRDRKKELPVWLPLASSFKNGVRKAEDAVPSGLFFLDIDEKGLTEQLWNKVREENLIEEFRIVYFAESAGGGTHIWAWRTPGFSIEEDIQKLASRLGVSYDSHVTDLARCCFMVSEQYVKLLDPVVFEDLTEEHQKQFEASPNPLQKEGATKAAAPKLPLPLERAGGEAERAGGEAFYRNIPYEMIVSKLLLATGYGLSPVEGERNQALYSTSRYLRYVCDFDWEKVCRVMPHFGLPETEALSTIKSAVGSARSNQMPAPLPMVLAECKREMQQIADEALMPTAIPQKLPRLLELLTKGAPQEFKEAVIMSTLPLLGTLATGLRAVYLDGEEHSPSFIVDIVAPAASGKSFTRRLVNLLLEPILKQDEAARQQEFEWQQECRSCGRGERPRDPIVEIRYVSPTMSNAMLLKRAVYANGKHLMTYAPEIDTLTKGNRAGAWSQKNDLFRMAWDNDMWGQDYISDQSFSGMTRLYYQILMCGTPNATMRFFSDVEDGLVSRVTFVPLPDMMGAAMPKFTPLTTEEEEEVKKVCLQLMDEKGIVELPLTSKALENWLEEKRQLFLDTQRPAIETYRRRAAAMGFRAAMLAFALSHHQESNEVVELALWVAERALAAHLQLFGERTDVVVEQGVAKMNRTSNSVRLLSELPYEFSKEQLQNLRVEHGQSSEVKMVIHRLVKHKKIEKIADNLWRKL